ncbi:MAG: sulfatase-like hydrolase/transferase [Candidatus Binatia bacterium]
MIDALRADRVSVETGNPRTPNLAALAADGVTFRNAFASAPKTVPSVPQTFTSRYFPDSRHDFTLLSAWKDAGYDRTMAFIHNPYVTKWLGRLDPTFDLLRGGEFDAVRITDDAIDALSRRGSDRIALYVHYLDVHVPLRPPADVAARFVDPSYRGPVGLEFADIPGAWAGRYDAADQQRIGDLYDATVAATDAQVGRLVETLRAEGLYDRALVIVTSDHGEELWEHGAFFHGHSLYDELLHVPLIVKFPGAWSAGARVDGLAGTIDILPTVTDLLSRASGGKLAWPERDGRSLVPLVTGEAAPRTLFATVGRVDDRSPPLHAVRSDNAKLIHDVRDGREQLFDLDRDPAERSDLAADSSSADRLATLRKELDHHMEPLARTGVHVRLTNGAASALHYGLEIGMKFVAPFVNFARFGLEGEDRIEVRRSDGLTMLGVLGPGDVDEVRFEVLATQGAITSVLTARESSPAIDVCVVNEADCVRSDGARMELDLARLETTAPPTRQPPPSSVRVEWWKIAGESEPMSPGLSPADRERLRALGYAE